jgi:hypothetical protein
MTTAQKSVQSEAVRAADRELLELAAKAAGVNAYALDGSPGMWVNTSPAHVHSWNPLTDDGDAFRLAAGLEIHILFGDKTKKVLALRGPLTALESCESDRPAATRRAIVRAAAEIGRAA